jgi:hypothetical protein
MALGYGLGQLGAEPSGPSLSKSLFNNVTRQGRKKIKVVFDNPKGIVKGVVDPLFTESYCGVIVYFFCVAFENQPTVSLSL